MTISVLNISNKKIKLKENTSLGTAQPVDQISIYSEENQAETADKANAI